MSINKMGGFIAFTWICYLFLIKANAFEIPDLSSLGKDPIIKSIESKYLIPGEKATLYGENFLENPKSGNRLTINNHPVRVINVKNNKLEFIVPNLRPQKTKIKLFTRYLGYKSKVFSFPIIKNDYVYISTPAPQIISTDKPSAQGNEDLTIKGVFSSKWNLFFYINEIEIIPSKISSNTYKIKLPANLPQGAFEISAAYKFTDGIYSQRSNKKLLLNEKSGQPSYLEIKTQENILTIPKKEYSFKIVLYFHNIAHPIDVTPYCKLQIESNESISLNEKTNTITAISNGKSKLIATFTWEPTKTLFKDEIIVDVETPLPPNFQEILIDEIFPFASSVFPQTDADMDGFAMTNDDKFIELQNISKKTFDLSNCTIYLNDSTKPNYEFTNNENIEPNSFLAIFGNQFNENKLSISGGTVELRCKDRTIDYVFYPPGKTGDHSWQRNSHLSGFIKHPLTLFSPSSAPPQFIPPTSSSGSLSPNTPTSSGTITIDSSSPINESNVKSISVIPKELIFQNSSPKQLQVFAEYDSGEMTEITNEATYKVTDSSNIVQIEQPGLIKPLTNGKTTIEISFSNKIQEVFANVNLLSNIKPKELIINEVLAAPSIDTNMDGIFKSDEDEFIEIVNVSNETLDIGGLTLSDNTKIRHTFQTGTTLQSKEPIVVFGGGNISSFGNNIKVLTADNGSLGLNNTGSEQVTISNTSGEIIDQIIFDNANLQGISLNRYPDLAFSQSLIAHDKFLKSTGKLSPGTRIDSSSFNSPPQEGLDILKSSSSGSITSSSSSSSGSLNSSSSGELTSSSSSSGSMEINSSSSSSSSGGIQSSSSGCMNP